MHSSASGFLRQPGPIDPRAEGRSRYATGLTELPPRADPQRLSARVEKLGNLQEGCAMTGKTKGVLTVGVVVAGATVAGLLANQIRATGGPQPAVDGPVVTVYKTPT